MTGRLADRLARMEAAKGLRLPHGRPLSEWTDAELCTLLGVPLDAPDEVLRRLADLRCGQMVL